MRFLFSLSSILRRRWKKWHHKMKCRRKQQLNNYIQCNLLTNRNSYLLACIFRQIHLMAGPYFFAQFTLISCIESLDFSFADTQDYVPNFRGCSVRFVVVGVVDDGCWWHRVHIWHTLIPLIASTQYFSKYGPFNLSIPLCSKYFSSL